MAGNKNKMADELLELDIITLKRKIANIEHEETEEEKKIEFYKGKVEKDEERLKRIKNKKIKNKILKVLGIYHIYYKKLTETYHLNCEKLEFLIRKREQYEKEKKIIIRQYEKLEKK